MGLKSILNNVKYLSSDKEFKKLHYRGVGTAGEKKAAKYIEEAFKKSGLKVQKQHFDIQKVEKENSKTVEIFYKGNYRICSRI